MSEKKSFHELGLLPNLLETLDKLGYEAPTPVQERSIPVLMEGRDLLAQAQTGTGKTAAFALPIISKLTIKLKKPQALIITPTRELAIQVAEAFQSYARGLKDFHVTPIYGGQDYSTQLRALRRGTHVIVGTPGRMMDHLRRGTIATDALKILVLDEADEMLKMGFIKDIEWILEQIPSEHQTALFSATMPALIQKIAKRYLKDAERIHIEPKSSTVDSIEQSYIRVAQHQKGEALTRYLESETIEAAIIFSRTKTGSAELAERLKALGYAAAALNGDMNQSARKKAVDRLKNGTLDILAATDVAARGLDIQRVSHVINYDIPHDTESYIHRIGRTGRAGRTGKALLFVTPREQRLLKDIERAVRKPIPQINVPSIKEINEKRGKQLSDDVINLIENSKGKLKPYHAVIEAMLADCEHSPKELAAALACLLQQANPLSSNELDIVGPSFEQEHKKKKRSTKSFSGKADRKEFFKKDKKSFSGGGKKRPFEKGKKKPFDSEKSQKKPFDSERGQKKPFDSEKGDFSEVKWSKKKKVAKVSFNKKKPGKK